MFHFGFQLRKKIRCSYYIRSLVLNVFLLEPLMVLYKETKLPMSLRTTINLAAALFTAVATTAFASSHREALAVLNEPCADNTDTYKS